MRQWKIVALVIMVALVILVGCASAMMSPRTQSLKMPTVKVKETVFKQEVAECEAELQKRVDAVNADAQAFYTKRDLGLDDLKRQAERNQRIKQIIFETASGGIHMATTGEATPAALAGFGWQAVASLLGLQARKKRKDEEEQMAVVVQAVEEKRGSDPEFADELSGLIGDKCKELGIPKSSIKLLTDVLKVKPLENRKAT